MTEYFIRKMDTNQYQISKFDGGQAPQALYDMKYYPTKDHWYCNCPGYWRQKNKAEHKHVRMAQIFRDTLKEEHGHAFWLDLDGQIHHAKAFDL